MSILIIGLLAGFLIGSVGVGGVIVAPALCYLLGLDIQEAIAAALMGFGFSGLVGTFRYTKMGAIQWRSAIILTVASMPAAAGGVLVMHELNASLVKFVVALAVLSSGVQGVLGWHKEEVVQSQTPPAATLAAVGVVTAFASVITGTGGPLVLIPLLISLQVPILAAVGLAQAIQVPISVAASAINASVNSLNVMVGATLAIGLAVGCWVGASVVAYLPAIMLRRIVASLLIGLGFVMLSDVIMQH